MSKHPLSAHLALADLLAGRQGDADGYVRLEVDAAAWEELARGCNAGLQDLSALWADDGVVRLALNDAGRGVRAIVSLTIATRPLAARSAAVKPRPRTMRVPAVAKYSGETWAMYGPPSFVTGRCSRPGTTR